MVGLYNRALNGPYILTTTHHITAGHIVTAKGDRLPGEIAYGVNFADVKSGLAAYDTIPAAGLAQLFFFIGLMELGKCVELIELVQLVFM